MRVIEKKTKRSPIADLPKAEKMVYVAEHVLKIVQQKGISGLNYATVARASGVSRAWLYKYVGPTREDLIKFAVRYFGKFYSELDVATTCTTREEFIEHALNGTKRIMEVTTKYPWIAPLYFRYYGTQTPIGQTIAHVESMYFEKVKAELEKYLGVKKMDARLLGELLAAINLGMSLRWLFQQPRQPDYPEKVASIVRAFLSTVS